jgi:hypothetical protein
MMQQAAFQQFEESLNTNKILKFWFISARGKNLLKNKIILMLFTSLGIDRYLLSEFTFSYNAETDIYK